MGDAKRRGSFQERKAKAIADKKAHEELVALNWRKAQESRDAALTSEQSRPFALQKHQVQGAAILGAAFSMLDSRARRITEMAALQQSTRVRGRPEIVVTLDDKGGFDVDR